MKREYKKPSLAILWVVTMVAAAALAGVGMNMGVLMVMVLGLVPSVVVLYFWREQPQTLSERIHEARR